MTREEAIAIIENEKECVNRANKNDYCNRDCYNCELVKTDTEILTALDMAIKALEQEPCEMTVEEYRQRMIQAFHNADTDELIAICALPTEKEFEHLEWLLKNHYKKEHCQDAISRQAAMEGLTELINNLKGVQGDMGSAVNAARELIKSLSLVKPQEPRWIPVSVKLPEYGEAVITVNSDDDYEINHIIDDDLNEWFYDEVIAWMPLPEPYKAESEEEG